MHRKSAIEPRFGQNYDNYATTSNICNEKKMAECTDISIETGWTTKTIIAELSNKRVKEILRKILEISGRINK